jgi:hypothetical protein
MGPYRCLRQNLNLRNTLICLGFKGFLRLDLELNFFSRCLLVLGRKLNYQHGITGRECSNKEQTMF